MPLVPTRIDRYEIKGRLGAGGMGSLYLARDTNPTTDRLVVLKLLRTSFDSDEPRQRFAREARSLAELSHPNIVVIYDSGEFEDSPFIVMEYVRGETLAEIIRRRAPMALGEKLRLMSELCAGLSHVHEAGIVHRDIKPANLAIDLHGRLKILDFGIARVDSDATLHAGRLTQLAVQIGTPGYMPPEQIESGEVDWRGDLFAVGAVAYELFSGREAFPGANTRQIERQVLGEQPVPLASSVPGLDPAIAEIIASALEKDVSKRCQSAAELAEAFDRVRARLPEESHPPRLTPPPPRPTGERKSRRERAADSGVRAGRDQLPGRRRGERPAFRDGGDRRAPGTRRRPPPARRTRPLPRRRTLAARRVRGAGRAERGGFVTDGDRAPAFPAAATAGPAAAAAISGAAGCAIWLGDRGADAGQGARLVGNARRHLGGRARVFGNAHCAAQGRVRRFGDGRCASEIASGGHAGRASDFAQATGVLDARRSMAPHCRRRAGSRRGCRRRGVVPLARGSGNATTTTPPAGGRGEGAGAVREGPPPAAPTEHLLTIDKPTGGTVEGPGIRCGTDGADCSVNQAAGVDVTLVARADAGFAFGGFTGECSSEGVAAMTAPRRCGAIFAKASVPAAGAARAGAGAPAAQSWTLTITRPTGGTILGDGIKCGTAGARVRDETPRGLRRHVDA